MAPVAVEPLVLLANPDKWLTESLESVLTQGGYRVLATPKRQQVLELARRQLPDAILLDMALDQRSGDNPGRCAGQRPDRTAPRPTPTLLPPPDPPRRRHRTKALVPGAGDPVGNRQDRKG